MRVFIADDSKIVVERLADLMKDVPGVQFADRQVMSRRRFAASSK